MERGEYEPLGQHHLGFHVEGLAHHIEQWEQLALVAGVRLDIGGDDELVRLVDHCLGVVALLDPRMAPVATTRSDRNILN